MYRSIRNSHMWVTNQIPHPSGIVVKCPTPSTLRSVKSPLPGQGRGPNARGWGGDVRVSNWSVHNFIWFEHIIWTNRILKAFSDILQTTSGMFLLLLYLVLDFQHPVDWSDDFSYIKSRLDFNVPLFHYTIKVPQCLNIEVNADDCTTVVNKSHIQLIGSKNLRPVHLICKGCCGAAER